MQIYGTKESVYIRKGINSHRIGLEHQYGRRDVKYARAVKQKVWNESQNRERDWGETLKILFSNKSVVLRLLGINLRKKNVTTKDLPPAEPRRDKTLVVRPAGVWARGLPLKFPALLQLS